MICYDDRYILKLAAEIDGIVVSNDNYRDLAQENPEFRRVIEERILMYSFVNDRFMPPDDPLGRSGPTLENFLRITPKKVDPAPPCPYAKVIFLLFISTTLLKILNFKFRIIKGYSILSRSSFAATMKISKICKNNWCSYSVVNMVSRSLKYRVVVYLRSISSVRNLTSWR